MYIIHFSPIKKLNLFLRRLNKWTKLMEALVCNSMQKYCEIIKWDWIWDLFYVDKILEFFDLPPPFVDILFSKIGIFLTPLPPRLST